MFWVDKTSPMYGMFHSSPNVSVTDIFAFFGLNWLYISPATSVLFGIIFATWLLMKIHRKVKGEDDDERVLARAAKIMKKRR